MECERPTHSSDTLSLGLSLNPNQMVEELMLSSKEPQHPSQETLCNMKLEKESPDLASSPQTFILLKTMEIQDAEKQQQQSQAQQAQPQFTWEACNTTFAYPAILQEAVTTATTTTSTSVPTTMTTIAVSAATVVAAAAAAANQGVVVTTDGTNTVESVVDQQQQPPPQPQPQQQQQHHRPFECEFCKKTFSKNSNLTSHRRLHTGERPFACEFCKKTFAKSWNLTSHRRIHTGERPYHCETCHKAFAKSWNLTNHRRTHTGEKPYGCKYCEKSFSHSSNLTSHIKSHTGDKPFNCQLCKKKFTFASQLTQHMRSHSGTRPYTCETCHKSFADQGVLAKHRKKHANTTAVSVVANVVTPTSVTLAGDALTTTTDTTQLQLLCICEFCKKTFTDATSLLTHKAEKHQHLDKPYECQYCTDTFINENLLNWHIRTHTGEVTTAPTLVAVTDSNKVAVAVAAAAASNSGAVAAFSCEYCHKTFTRSDSLTVHIRTHSTGTGAEIPTISCDVCNKTFLSQNQTAAVSGTTTATILNCQAPTVADVKPIIEVVEHADKSVSPYSTVTPLEHKVEIVEQAGGYEEQEQHETITVDQNLAVAYTAAIEQQQQQQVTQVVTFDSSNAILTHANLQVHYPQGQAAPQTSSEQTVIAQEDICFKA